VLVQTVTLNGPRGPANFLKSATNFDTTPFQLSTSPDGKFLFVTNHETLNPVGNAAGNALYILKRAADGTLTEIPSSPVIHPASEPPGHRPSDRHRGSLRFEASGTLRSRVVRH
jgi:hypothetical protein